MLRGKWLEADLERYVGFICGGFLMFYFESDGELIFKVRSEGFDCIWGSLFW